MPITKENVLQHELIGLKAEVVESSNPQLVGRKGKIVDETRNTLTLEEGEYLKVKQKKEVSLSETLPKGAPHAVNPTPAGRRAGPPGRLDPRLLHDTTDRQRT